MRGNGTAGDAAPDHQRIDHFSLPR
jgi:hypothetical protein